MIKMSVITQSLHSVYQYIDFNLDYVFDGTELVKWLPHHLCTSYFLAGPLQLKPAWMLWCWLCGVDFSLDRTLDKTTGWIKSLPGCPTIPNWQPCSSVPTILTRSLTAFLPETKWIASGYHYCNYPNYTTRDPGLQLLNVTPLCWWTKTIFALYFTVLKCCIMILKLGCYNEWSSPHTCGLKGELQSQAAVVRLMGRLETWEAEGH